MGVGEGQEARWKSIGDIDPWLLEGPTALRPAPPPAPGTPDFKAAIAETRAMSDAATPEQIFTARYWAGTDSGNLPRPSGMEIAAAELAGETDASAVRVLALMNTAMHEAAIGCFEAKYWFNYPRPSQVDSGIKPRGLSAELPGLPFGPRLLSPARPRPCWRPRFPKEAKPCRPRPTRPRSAASGPACTTASTATRG